MGGTSFILFVLFVGLAQISNYWANGFYTLAGLFGGIIASVVVAWLVDEQNCKSKNCDNKSLCDEIWRNFDMIFESETVLCLTKIAQTSNFDIEKEWSIKEFSEIIKTLKNNLHVTIYFEMIFDYFLEVDLDKLIYPFYSETNRAIYSMSQMLVCNIKAFKNFSSSYEIMNKTVLLFIELIYDYRGLHPVFKIAEKDYDMIEKYRNAIQGKKND